MLTKGYGNKRESYSQVPPCVRATAGASNRHTHTHTLQTMQLCCCCGVHTKHFDTVTF